MTGFMYSRPLLKANSYPSQLHNNQCLSFYFKSHCVVRLSPDAYTSLAHVGLVESLFKTVYGYKLVMLLCR